MEEKDLFSVPCNPLSTRLLQLWRKERRIVVEREPRLSIVRDTSHLNVTAVLDKGWFNICIGRYTIINRFYVVEWAAVIVTISCVNWCLQYMYPKYYPPPLLSSVSRLFLIEPKNVMQPWGPPWEATNPANYFIPCWIYVCYKLVVFFSGMKTTFLRRFLNQ